MNEEHIRRLIFIFGAKDASIIIDAIKSALPQWSSYADLNDAIADAGIAAAAGYTLREITQVIRINGPHRLSVLPMVR